MHKSFLYKGHAWAAAPGHPSKAKYRMLYPRTEKNTVRKCYYGKNRDLLIDQALTLCYKRRFQLVFRKITC